jgi:Flp pilus assembly protein TadD
MSVNYTVADLKPRILDNIDSLEYPAAYTYCQKALELEPHNAEILEITGQVELELEQFELARKVKEKVNIPPYRFISNILC